LLAHTHLNSSKSEELGAGRRGRGASSNVNDIALDSEKGVAISILGDQRSRSLASSECEELAVGDGSTTISTAAAREHDKLIAGGTARVEVEAALGL
jgi:hypothetical protein